MVQPAVKPDREISGGGDFAAGSGPVHYGSAAIGLQTDEDVKVDLSNANGNHTFTVTPRGGPAYSYTVSSRGLKTFHGKSTSRILIDSADSNAIWERGVRGAFDGTDFPGAIQAIQGGTWAAQLLDSGGTNKASIDVSGDLRTNQADAAGNLRYNHFASGSACPADGTVRFTASVTDANGVTVSDGTTAQPLAPLGTIAKTSTASVWQNYEFAAISGKTYTLTGTGIIVLGGNLVVV